ncbi:MAG: DevR family CRISPR-associated autoregulator [Chloroflexi bacterium]|nr:DevR family CRISPR-associated autoregulator [Chloroflexota bacterium]MBM4431846.1 DevR family CRISPR-associated autoregulator [Chloroflexota bacterium]
MSSIYSLSVSACATLNLHSLNNEGGEGNQIQTRMVNIVGEDGRLYNVNAISGDMWKHIQAEHLFRLAKDSGSVPLCAACQVFDANRISADQSYCARLAEKGVSDAQATDWLLQSCALDDMEGNLITTGGRSLPRKSVIEFGWVVGRPEVTTTDSYFHVKYAIERGQDRRAADSAEAARGANLGQAIFHRPASSGRYAIVANLELARIGFNDITQKYPLDEDARRARCRLLLESVLYAFLEPNGAMRNTQNPHIVALEGVVALSRGPIPAPTVSPLRTDYREQIEGIVAGLQPLHKGTVELRSFDSLAGFAKAIAGLIETEAPYTLRY